jgi:hypothetical protein
VQGVVDGPLPRSGILGGHGDVPGRREVAGSGLYKVGSSEGFCRMAQSRWGFTEVVVIEGNREERAWQSDALGLLLLPRVQLGNDKG